MEIKKKNKKKQGDYVLFNFLTTWIFKKTKFSCSLELYVCNVAAG